MNNVFDKNVPIPMARRKNDRFGFYGMQIGDSKFIAPSKDDNLTNLQINIAGMAKRKVGDGAKFVTRVLIESGVKGVRIWRTA